jgi:predicted N-acetyltransferase YhbS
MNSLLHIQTLDPTRHDRANFDCGVTELNDYLARRARKEIDAGVAACFVATETEGGSQIVGYYTLSAATITRTSLPETLVKKLPRYPELPAILLGRLAVAADSHGKGVGTRLLYSAMSRSLDASTEIGALALVTDPKDDAAAEFYGRFGFQPLASNRLFLPMRDIKNLLSAR